MKDGGREGKFHEALLSGAGHMGLDISPDAARRLVEHWRLLVRWNRKVNLTAVTDPLLAAEALYLDSAVVVRWLAAGRTVHDVGSGAGFPGLVIKAMCPETEVRLTEARRRKVSFLRRAASSMDLLPGLVIECRRLGWPRNRPALAGEVLSRATFPPREWMRQGAGLVEPAGRLWLYLGHHLADEGRTDEHVPEAPEGFVLERRHHYRLPFSDRRRTLVSYRRVTGG